MAQRNTFLIFAAGLLTGVVGMIALSGNHAVPRAVAQGGLQARTGFLPSPGRFQIAAWAYPAAQGGPGPIPSAYGAYILDTQAGTVWQTKDGGKLESVEIAK